MGFAKLFESNKFGQLLVKLDTNSDDQYKPEVRLYLEPDGLGVCSVAVMFPNTDAGWDDAEKAFENYDIDMAEKMAEEIVSKFLELTGDAQVNHE